MNLSSSTSRHQVVIAGAGPDRTDVGGGVDAGRHRRSRGGATRHAEPRELPLGGLHARTIEVLDQRGVADRFLAEGQAMQVQAFAGVPLDISDFPSRHPYGLAQYQSEFERILAAWVDELGAPIVREREVTGFAQDGEGVEVELSNGQSVQARVPRRMRRGTQRGAKGGGDRVRGLGSDHQLADRRGRNGAGAALRATAGRWHRTGGRRRAGGRRIDRRGADRTATRAHGSTDAAGPQRGADRRRRDRLRSAQSELDLPLQRHDAAGGLLSRGTRPPGRRCRAHPCSARRAGSQHRRTGCREPGLEVGTGPPRGVARELPGHLRCRTPPGRGPRPDRARWRRSHCAGPTPAPRHCREPSRSS